MDDRQEPPRIIRIATAIILIGILGTLLWLFIAPPAIYVQYKLWFRAAFDLVIGIILASCGLFYNSWFTTLMGVHRTPAILQFGPEKARIGITVIGLIFIGLGIAGVLVP